MSRELFRVSVYVCAVVDALMVYSLITMVIASLLIRRVKSRRPRIVPSPVAAHRSASARAGREPYRPDRQWAVVLVMLGAPAVADRAQPFVDVVARTVDWPRLLLEASTWSKEDRLLVHVAYDLRDQGYAEPAPEPIPVAVRDLMAEVDQPRTDLIVAALNLRRGTCSLDDATKIAMRTGNAPPPSRPRVPSRLRQAR